MIRIERHLTGPRVYLLGLRVHHGTTGLALATAAVAAGRPALAIVGLALTAHDARDFPFRDCDNH